MSATAAVIDYGAGNIRSVTNSLDRIGARYHIVSSPKTIAPSDHVIFPGVGEARTAMENLKAAGMDDAIRNLFRDRRPLLGICVGAQVVLDYSEERDIQCLGIIAGASRKFGAVAGRKVPHMGWNSVEYREEERLFDGIPQNASFYFLHSFYPDPNDDDRAIAWSDYRQRFVAALRFDTLCAVQFHPEKSGRYGLMLLSNFLTL